ncbi:MAG: transporter [Phycisphaerae bacterium]|nr:transporter [Phycisphaerae bacterium]
MQQSQQQDTTKAPLSDEELAKKLANPVAAMISVPFQGNYDRKIGPNNDGDRYQLNFQPVVPIELNDDWNLISRTIVPIIDQNNILPGSGRQKGVGDVLQSFFFSPRKPTDSGWILGAGPVFLLPTASNDLLGAEKWGAGPTFVGLRQEGPWTYGLLANHIWSFAGNKNRADISSTYAQPFASYTTKDAWTFTAQTEMTYNWKTDEWSIPLEGTAAKMLSFGNQKVTIFGGLKYWVDSPDSGPQGLGFRFGITLLFPN